MSQTDSPAQIYSGMIWVPAYLDANGEDGSCLKPESRVHCNLRSTFQ
ncbi:MAG: hypothetical protein SFW36_18795 [Leptolyngbyaceae cyanobacterium bins.59]|nr:hypothetical protein [Leptolyngbyaceae cyanobacterium bins.59]